MDTTELGEPISYGCFASPVLGVMFWRYQSTKLLVF
jgi:hypothetical protein